MSEQRRLAAIMFTDICGFSSIMGADEERALAIVEMQKNCVADGASMHGGRIAKEMGDGLLVEFPSAVNAVRCALAVQRAVAEFNKTADPDEQFLLRIGIHVGDVVVAGDDILGDGVNVASRIEPLADPGGICISRDIFDLVHNKISIETVHLGAHDLKNISRQVSIYKVLLDAVAPGAIATPTLSKPMPLFKYGMIAGLALVLLVVGVVISKRHLRAAPVVPAATQTATGQTQPAAAVSPRTQPPTANDVLRERHNTFIKAVFDKDRQEALGFVPPEVLTNSNPDMIWRRMALIAGILQAGPRSRDDFRLKAVNLSDSGQSAAVVMQVRKPSLDGRPERWNDIQPVKWRQRDGVWYLDIDTNPDSMPRPERRQPDRRRIDEKQRDAIPHTRRLPRP